MVVRRSFGISESERGILLLKRGEKHVVRVRARPRSGRRRSRPQPAASRRSVIDHGRARRPPDHRPRRRTRTRCFRPEPLRRGDAAPAAHVRTPAGRRRSHGRRSTSTRASIGPPHTSREDLLLFNAQAGLASSMAVHEPPPVRARRIAGARDAPPAARRRARSRLRLLPDTPMQHARDPSWRAAANRRRRVGGDYFDFMPHRQRSVDRLRRRRRVGPRHRPRAHHVERARAPAFASASRARSLSGLYGFMNRALCEDLDRRHVRGAVRRRSTTAKNASCWSSRTRARFRRWSTRPSPTTAASRSQANAPALGIIDDLSAGPCPQARRCNEGDYLLVRHRRGDRGTRTRRATLYGEDRVRKLFLREHARKQAPRRLEIVNALRDDRWRELHRTCDRPRATTSRSWRRASSRTRVQRFRALRYAPCSTRTVCLGSSQSAERRTQSGDRLRLVAALPFARLHATPSPLRKPLGFPASRMAGMRFVARGRVRRRRRR